MPILVSCPGCAAQLNAPDNAVGKAIKCPKCQTVINVPGAGAAPPPTPAPAPAPGGQEFGAQPSGGGPVAGPSGGGVPPGAPNKLVIGILAILFGWTGIHKFMLGYTTPGLIMLIPCLCCVGFVVMPWIGLIEGIMYLTKSDEEFYQTYVANKKEWF